MHLWCILLICVLHFPLLLVIQKEKLEVGNTVFNDSTGNNFPPNKPLACPVWQCQVSHQRGCAGTSQAEANAFPLLLPWAGFQQTWWVGPSSREGLCQVWAGAGAGRSGAMLSSGCRVVSSTAGNSQGCIDFSVAAVMHGRDFQWKLPVKKQSNPI